MCFILGGNGALFYQMAQTCLSSGETSGVNHDNTNNPPNLVGKPKQTVAVDRKPFNHSPKQSPIYFFHPWVTPSILQLTQGAAAVCFRQPDISSGSQLTARSSNRVLGAASGLPMLT
jgi:hypothetical protein